MSTITAIKNEQQTSSSYDEASIALTNADHRQYLLRHIDSYDGLVRSQLGVNETTVFSDILPEAMRHSRDTLVREYLRHVLCAQGVLMLSYGNNPAGVTRSKVATIINEITGINQNYTLFESASTYRDPESGMTRIALTKHNFPIFGDSDTPMENYYLALSFETIRDVAMGNIQPPRSSSRHLAEILEMGSTQY